MVHYVHIKWGRTSIIELVGDLRAMNVLATFQNDPWKFMDARTLTVIFRVRSCKMWKKIAKYFFANYETTQNSYWLTQGVQPWALTKFPDFSLTFPWPFCGFPWSWDILSAFHYCLNANFASNLTNHSPKVAITKWYPLGRLSKYKIWCFKLSQDYAQWQPSELNTLEGQTVLWFLIIFYYLDCTKCKFPDLSLTFPNIHFFPDLQQNSLTFPWLLPSLEFPWLFPDRWTPCNILSPTFVLNVVTLAW